MCRHMSDTHVRHMDIYIYMYTCIYYIITFVCVSVRFTFHLNLEWPKQQFAKKNIGLIGSTTCCVYNIICYNSQLVCMCLSVFDRTVGIRIGHLKEYYRSSFVQGSIGEPSGQASHVTEKQWLEHPRSVEFARKCCWVFRRRNGGPFFWSSGCRVSKWRWK